MEDTTYHIVNRKTWVDSEGGQGSRTPPPFENHKFAICFTRNTGTDTPGQAIGWVQFLLKGGLYSHP